MIGADYSIGILKYLENAFLTKKLDEGLKQLIFETK